MKTILSKVGKPLLVAFISIGATITEVRAGDSSPAYNFLNLPISTLSYGLGGINISNIDDDASQAWQNPALLGPEIGMQAVANYMHYIGDSNFGGACFGRAAGEHSAWGIGLQYFGYGSIKGADVEGNLTSEFSPKDIVVTATYSRDITDRWRGGVNLKFCNSTYDSYSAMALATDLGINYYDPESDQSFSFVVANLGGQIKRFDKSYDRLPFDLRLGWTGALGTGPIRLSVTAWNLTKWKLPYWDNGDGTEDPVKKDKFASNLFRHLIFGADFAPSEAFHLGIGYNYKTRTDMSTYNRSFLSGFSACAGFKGERFGVGVALAQPHTGATTVMINLAYNF